MRGGDGVDFFGFGFGFDGAGFPEGSGIAFVFLVGEGWGVGSCRAAASSGWATMGGGEVGGSGFGVAEFLESGCGGLGVGVDGGLWCWVRVEVTSVD